jgi:hypothetical protein
MPLNFRAGKILIVIFSVCLISFVSAATLKSSPYYLNKAQSESIAKSNTQADINAPAKKDYSVAGFKIKSVPEHQSYILFLSGFFGIVGVGWVKRKKA